MPGRRAIEVVGGHHGMGELSALIGRDVRARAAREGCENRYEDAAPEGRQLFCAPAATHWMSAHFAAELMDPEVGMLPPKSLRHELPCTTSDELVPLM